ncbi:MAG: hypothetical protein Q8L35_00300 [Actinomycetota bacterium]|nr:hypothetical protein [Actinomycetota bacterium]
MCHAQNRICECSADTAILHFGNNVLPENIVRALYCPKCGQTVDFIPESMLKDNGWIIDFEIEGARLFAHEFPAAPDEITPEYIFDKGFCTWVGYTPTDQLDSYNEKTDIIELAKTDRARYFQEMKDWSINRAKRLAEAGWRKAKAAV